VIVENVTSFKDYFIIKMLLNCNLCIGRSFLLHHSLRKEEVEGEEKCLIVAILEDWDISLAIWEAEKCEGGWNNFEKRPTSTPLSLSYFVRIVEKELRKRLKQFENLRSERKVKITSKKDQLWHFCISLTLSE